MKKQLFLFVLMMLPVVASAETVEVDGFYFNLNYNTKTAELTSDPDRIREYSGNVVIPESFISKSARYCVTSIGSFAGGTDLISVTIPESVTSIGDYAFSGCISLTSLTIPNSVTSIGERAFYNCSGLTSVTIGSSVTVIGRQAFDGCSSLNSLNILDLEAWCNISFGSSLPSYHLFLNGQEVKHLVIPDGVTSIGEDAFHSCIGLTSVIIPNSVTSIGESAFMYCTGLTSLTIPNSVTTIDHEAFEDCRSLNYVIIGDGVTTIGGEAFKDCKNLNYVILGSGITTVYGGAFGNSDKLTDFYCYAETVPTTDGNVFKKTYIENATLHVPVASVDAYKATEPWSGFGTIVGFDGSVDPKPISKCETPTISFVNGELTFTCPTDGVEFVSMITSADAKMYYDKSIVPTNKYIVSVYATKEGYDHSETVTKEITIGGNSGEGSGVFGDINGDGVVNAADIVQIANIIMGE
jgi:hypothetical protein